MRKKPRATSANNLGPCIIRNSTTQSFNSSLNLCLLSSAERTTQTKYLPKAQGSLVLRWVRPLFSSTGNPPTFGRIAIARSCAAFRLSMALLIDPPHLQPACPHPLAGSNFHLSCLTPFLNLLVLNLSSVRSCEKMGLCISA